MKKKLLSIALGAAMVASMLAGCGSNASTTAPAASTPAPRRQNQKRLQSLLLQKQRQIQHRLLQKLRERSIWYPRASSISSGRQCSRGQMKLLRNTALKLISRDPIPNPISHSRYRC